MTVQSNTGNCWQDFDAFIEAYELAWTSGTVPKISDFLPARQHPKFTAILTALARVDLELRWKISQPLTLAIYLDEFPELKVT